MKTFLKIVLPLAIIAGAFALGKMILATGPEAKKRPVQPRVTTVETMQVKPQDYPVVITASGIVQTSTQTTVASEVSGKIIEVSPNFQEGAYFDKGDTLLRIDTANYDSAIKIAESDLQASRYSLQQLDAEEKANINALRLAQNNLNLGQKELERVRGIWNKRLIARSVLDAEEQKITQLQQQVADQQGKLSTYASRKAALQANMASAEARLERERLNLSRTRITAPYSGRVLEQRVDLGQFVSTGTVLGTVYATDSVDVELPLSLQQYEWLGMPEHFRNREIDTSQLPRVTFTSTTGSQPHSWQGKIIRSNAALDDKSRQIKVIARIDNPFEVTDQQRAPVRIGQYLTARINGKTLENVYVLPPTAVRQGRDVLLMVDAKVSIEPIEQVWNNDSEVVVRSQTDLSTQQIITTSLPNAVNGQAVQTPEQAKARAAKRAQRQKENDSENNTSGTDKADKQDASEAPRKGPRNATEEGQQQENKP